MKRAPRLFVWICLLLGSGMILSAAETLPEGRRTLNLEVDGRWIGHGVCLSPYRDGQSPKGDHPSDAEILADLQLVAPYWQLLRMYDSNSVSERTLALIQREKLPLRLLLGVWIDPEHDEASRAGNREQTATAIRLANEYADIVAAVLVGNETCVYWSAHRVGPEALIPWIKQVRTAVPQPVSTADDYNFWNKPESQVVADEVELHPNVPVTFGETGWSTSHVAMMAFYPLKESMVKQIELDLAARKATT
jgi:hypothetical protein